MEDLYRVHHTNDLLGILVAQIEPKMFLHSQNKLHPIQGVEAQLIESGGPGKFVSIALCGTFKDLENFPLDILYDFILI